MLRGGTRTGSKLAVGSVFDVGGVDLSESARYSEHIAVITSMARSKARRTERRRINHDDHIHRYYDGIRIQRCPRHYFGPRRFNSATIASTSGVLVTVVVSGSACSVSVSTTVVTE